MVQLLIASVLVFLSCGGAVTQSVSKTRTQVISRALHIDPPLKGESRYRYVSFPVSPGTQLIKSSYSYDHANGANALDIGLFDSHSRERVGDATGFRGWSGGRRSEFFVSPDTATPGYVAGAMPSGTWRIILGLYRVVPAGVDVTFQIAEEINESKKENLAVASQTSPALLGSTVSFASNLAIRNSTAL